MGGHGADDRPRGTAAQTAVGLIGIALELLTAFCLLCGVDPATLEIRTVT